MRILTVRQPWAWAIIHAGKNVENRSRNIAGSYRGPVLIHAGLTAVDNEDALWNADLFRSAMHTAPPESRKAMSVRGAIPGVVDLVDVHSASVLAGCGRIRHDCPEHGTCRDHCSPWAEGPSATGWLHHLVLENPRPLAEPIAYRGGLGLRRVPQDVADAALRALNA